MALWIGSMALECKTKDVVPIQIFRCHGPFLTRF